MAYGEYQLVRDYYRKVTGSMAGYASAMVARAKRDNAPADAVHWSNGRWYTAAEIKNEETRRTLGLPPLGSGESN